MKIYISGAISGIPGDNKKAFLHAQAKIVGLISPLSPSRLKIINPIHLGAKLRRDFKKNNSGDPQWNDYMKVCVKKLVDADCVFFLPDWAGSKGASVERYVATRLGIPCVDGMEDLKNIVKQGAEI